MSRFVLTAQLQLQAPTNVAQVAKQIQNQLSNVTVNVQTKGAAQATKQMKDLTKATQSANTAAFQLGKTFASSLKRFAAFSVATRFVSLFTQGVGGAVDEAIKFERELIKVAQVTGKTVAQLSDLTAEIRKLATGLGVSSAELLNVTRQLSQAGLTAYETKVALDALAKSSLAPTFEDMAKTAEGAIAIFNQFGKGASALEGQLGAINAVAGQFAVEAGDLISVIRRTGGVFKAAGGDLNELIALFTSVRATTRESAESIATGLRTIFTRIQRPRTIKFLEQLGVSLTDVEGKFVGPFEAIKRLSEALGDLEQGDLAFVRIAEELGGFRQIGKVIPLLQQFATAQEAYNTALAGSNSLSKDAEAAQDTLAVKLTKLREEFLATFRTITESTGFKIMADAAISLAKAILQISEALTPLLPLMTAFAGIKIAKGLGGFLAGAKAGGLGAVPKFASGGVVPGSGNRDTVPAMLTPGEFVIRKSSVQKLGADNLKRMNAQGYASGGTVKLKDNTVGGFFLVPSEGEANSPFGYKPSSKSYAGSELDIRNPLAIKALTGKTPKRRKLGDSGFFGQKGMSRKDANAALDSLRPGLSTTLANTAKPNSKGEYTNKLADGSNFSAESLQGAAAAAGQDYNAIKGALEANAAVESHKPGKVIADNMIGMFLGQNDQALNAKAAKAVSEATVKGLRNTTDDALASGPIKSIVKGISGKVQPNVSSMESVLADLFDPGVAGGAVQTTEGYILEGITGALTGSKVGGGGTAFDFPSVDKQIKSIKEIYGNDIPDSLLSADAKRQLGAKSKKSIFNKAYGVLKNPSSTMADISKYFTFSKFFGGSIPKFAKGGPAPSDTVPAMLTPGEFVVSKKAAQSIGPANLNRMNKRGVQGFAKGGPVGMFFGGGAGGGGMSGMGTAGGGMTLLALLPAIESGLTKLLGPSDDMSDGFTAAKAGLQTLVSSLMMTKGSLMFFAKETDNNTKNTQDNTKATAEETEEKKQSDQTMEISGQLSIHATGELMIKGITTVILHAAQVQMGKAAAAADPSAANKAVDPMAALTTPSGPAMNEDWFNRLTTSIGGQGVSALTGDKLSTGSMGLSEQLGEAEQIQQTYSAHAGQLAGAQVRLTEESNKYTQEAASLSDDPALAPLKESYLQQAQYFADQAKAAGDSMQQYQAIADAATAAMDELSNAAATAAREADMDLFQIDLPSTDPAGSRMATPDQMAAAGLGPTGAPVEDLPTAGSIISGWAKSLKGLVDDGKAQFAEYWGEVFDEVGLAVEEGVELKPGQLGIGSRVKRVGSSIAGKGAAVKESVGSFGRSMKDMFQELTGIGGTDIFGGVKEDVEKESKGFLKSLNIFGDQIRKTATDGSNKVSRGLAQAGVILGDSLTGGGKAVKGVFDTVADSITKAGGYLANKIRDAANKISDGGGIKGALKKFGGGLKKFTVGLANVATTALSFAAAITSAAAAYTQAKFDKAVELGDYDAGMSMIDANYQTQDLNNRMGSAVSGAASGAALGATLGSVIPGIGTAVGGAIGAIGGGIAGFFKDDLMAMLGLGPSAEEREKKFREESEAKLAAADIEKNLAPKLKEQLESFATGGLSNEAGKNTLNETLATIAVFNERIAAIEKVDPQAAKALRDQQEKVAFGLAETIGSTAQSQGELDAAMAQLTAKFPELREKLENAAKSAQLVAEANRAQAKLRADLLVTTSVFGAATLAVNNFVSGLETGGNTWNATVATLEEAQKNIALGKAGTDAVEEARDRVNKQLGASGVGTDSAASQAINRQFDTLNTAAEFTSNLPAVLAGTAISKSDKDQVVKDKLQQDMLDAAGVTEDSEIGKIIKGRVAQLTPEQIGGLQSGSLQLSDVFQDLAGQIGQLGQGALEAAKALQAQEQLIINLTKERIAAEKNLIDAQKQAVDLQLEAAQIAAEFGGASVTAEQRRNAAIEKFNLTAGRVGAGALTSGTGSDIRNASGALAGQFASLELRSNRSGAFSGAAGLDADKRQEIVAAQKELVSVTKALIEADKQELNIIKQKNALEKSSLDALISGDVDTFFKQQAAAQATQVLAAGGDASGFGGEALGAALENIRKQRQAGVTDIGGTNIRDVEARAAQAALASRGITDPRAAAMLSGQTQQEQEIEARIRERAGALGAIGENMVDMAQMQVQSAEMTIQSAQIKFNQGLAEAAGQFDVAGLARGGMVYASRGMFVPRGTDTVPAMLTPGEFVVNRASVNRGNNLQILRAMNNGSQSAAPATGGAVAMNQGGQVRYYNNGDLVTGAMDGSILEGLNAFNTAFAQNIANLQNTRFQIKLDTTNVVVTLNGGSFLNSMKEEVKSELLAEVGNQISSLKFNDAGEAKVNKSVLGK